MRLRFRKKPKLDKAQRKELVELLHIETQKFISKDDLKKYLADIETDERKKRLWNSLSNKKKIQLLRYRSRKGGAPNEKR